MDAKSFIKQKFKRSLVSTPEKELRKEKRFRVEEVEAFMEEYAEKKCIEQRHECQIEMDKRSVVVDGEFYIHSEDILNCKLATDK